MRVTLSGGGKPATPVTLQFDLSGDPQLANAFKDEVKPVVRSMSDGDGGAATDLLRATWDRGSKTVTATTNHLSIFQVIATNVRIVGSAVTDAWKQVGGQANSSCRGKSEATIGAVKLTLTPSKAGPVAGCLRDAGGGAVAVELTNGTRQYYGVTSSPAGQFSNPPLLGGDDVIASWLRQNSSGRADLLTPRSSGRLVLPAGTGSGTIHLDVDPVLLQMKTLLAAVGMVGLDGDAVLSALKDSKEGWDCFTTMAKAPASVIPGNVSDFRQTLTELAQCGLSAADKAVMDRNYVLHRMGVAISLLTTLPDQFLANVTGAIGEVSGDNHLTFTLSEHIPTSTSQSGPIGQSTGEAINRIDVTTWAYDRVEGDTYVADNTGAKKIEVFWKSFAGAEQVRSGCKSTVQIEGPATSEFKEVSGCDSYNSGSYLNAHSPGVYTVTVTVHQDGQPEITAQRTVTILPKGGR
ncbi:hypothetical protein [Mycobacterium sp. E740]|uniref:hypothetical protein n=1 Tax=Mycobacterium sp. E740 TaxID=1834149 RepID=UPI0012EAAB62|nr:hypothetical protein [Mycobacterium sp. E740]